MFASMAQNSGAMNQNNKWGTDYLLMAILFQTCEVVFEIQLTHKHNPSGGGNNK